VTSETYLRRVAASLLRLAVKVAPQDSFVWGQAVLAELNYVKGDWPALAWAFGGAVVLTKRAMVSLILPGRRRTAISSKPDLFAKEGPMRKATLAAVGACAVASLLFFLAPVFRHAFQASLAQWQCLADFTHYDDRRPSPELEAVARLAEQNHDAEGLAFVAMRHPKESESARLADEAVQLDSKLTWVYAAVAVSHPTLPQIERWVPKIEQFDPENALPYFIVAEAVDIDQVLHDKVPKKTSDESPAWKNAMASAFQSPKLDNYLERLKALDRGVMLRYRFDDLYQALDNSCWWYLLPSYSTWDSSRYAELVLRSGKTLEARGDLTGARDKYLAVARFSQIMTSAGVHSHHWEVNVPQEAYKRLQAFSEKDGLQEHARFYASLAAQSERADENDRIARRNRFRDSDVSRWSANLIKTAGVAMLLCAGILLTCLVHVVRKRQLLRPNSLGLGRITTAFGIGAAVGLLLSSAILYVTYRPYAEIFQGYLHTGDESQLPLLSSLLGHTGVLLGSEGFNGDVRVYFWFVVSALCVLALLLAVITFVAKHLRVQDSI
jgi:hypothetical protein